LMALYWIGPKAEKKRIPQNLGSQFVTLGANVTAFISNLGGKQQAENAQNWLQVFSALTRNAKRALVSFINLVCM